MFRNKSSHSICRCPKMHVHIVEKACFDFLHRFYFYLWPPLLSWDKNYTKVTPTVFSRFSCKVYTFWTVFSLFYVVAGLCVSLYCALITNIYFLSLVDSLFLIVISCAILLVWILFQLTAKLCGCFNDTLAMSKELLHGI